MNKSLPYQPGLFKDEIVRQILEGKRSLPVLAPQQIDGIVNAFSDDLTCEDVYLFWDGRIVSGDEFRRSPQVNYTYGLVSIASDGFPVNISRSHQQIREVLDAG